MEDLVLHKIDKIFIEKFPKLHKEFEDKNYSLKDFQKRVITNVEKHNTLCIMPTGGGKSLIYWLAGVMNEGITIVISPLTALIDEQAEKIKEQGLEVLTLHSGINAGEQEKTLINFANGKFNPKFIFASPEKMGTDGFFEYCVKKRKNDIKLIVIDEVHCVSQWGASFRPFYKRIPDFFNRIYDHINEPKILALTATLNPKEVQDICNEFDINKQDIIRDNLLMRSEISLKILKFSDETEKENKLWDLIKIHKNEKILVYAYRKKSNRGVEKLAEKATEKGYESVFFHGDINAKERQQIISRYKNDEISVIFATNAFGMGIDISDIRVVIHYMIPESVEQYYQEIGRAARDAKDGGVANAYLLYTSKNIDVKRKYFIEGSFPNENELNNNYKKISGNNKGLSTFPFFENEEIQKCFPYYLESGSMSIRTKGFSGMKNLVSVNDVQLKKLLDISTTKTLLTTAKKSGLDVQTIVDTVYEALVTENAYTNKPMDKRLVLDIFDDIISPDKMETIMSDINQMLVYKKGLLDYFVYLLNECDQSNELHQEIAYYLGVERHMLNKIYSTVNGDKVRSKSEVIIANLLSSNKINYCYEKKLRYSEGKWIEPDFTIILDDGSELYWEHLGMLGLESYDKRWLEKLDIYDKYFPNKLLTTYEGASITNNTLDVISKILQSN